MKKIALISVSLAVLASSNVFAEGKTRAEVYQELIQAQADGLDFVTDASYPDVSPIYRQTVDYLKQQRALAAANSSTNAMAASQTGAN